MLSSILLLTGLCAIIRAQSDLDKLTTTLDLLRERNARDYALAGPGVIDEARYVKLGGIEQWITIRGENRYNPVLLFLHGGPGEATNPYGYAVFRSWLRHFTIVQWDQRGAGRTLGKNGRSIADTITIDRMTQDGVELAEFLCKSLNKDKIILVGHSWGSILGVFMVKVRPEIFSAFVGTGQVADPLRNYSIAYAELLKKAKLLGDQNAIKELTAVGPPPYSSGSAYAVQRKWSNLFEHADVFLLSTLGLALSAPGYTLRDFNDWLEGEEVSAERLVPVTSKLKRESLTGNFAVPVFVIQGAEDFTAPTSMARGFLRSISAPKKAFVEIKDSGHFAVFMKSDAFLRELVMKVLPAVSGTARGVRGKRATATRISSRSRRDRNPLNRSYLLLPVDSTCPSHA